MKYYKIVRVMPDGKLLSSFASGDGTPGSGGSGNTWMNLDDYPMLVYHPNRIMSAPKGYGGIFLAEGTDLPERVHDYNRMGEFYRCTVKVFEAHPIGVVTLWNDFPTCRVVRIGKEVKIKGWQA